MVIKNYNISSSSVWLLYDGECPFCSYYVKSIRLREAVGEISLINARDQCVELDQIKELGLNIDAGMVFNYGGNYYHGDDCMHMLALLSSSSGIFNKLNAVLFSFKHISRFLYSILRFYRNLVLLILGRKGIEK